MLVLVNENGQWRVNELAQIADPQELLSQGYSFKDAYIGTENIMAARQNGYLMNGNGEIFANIDENAVQSIPESLLRAVKNTRTVPTSKTTIVYGTYSNGTYQSKKTINFHDYCLGVSAGEVKRLRLMVYMV